MVTMRCCSVRCAEFSLIALVGVICLFFTTGCSVIGYTLGAQMAREDTLKSAGLRSLARGEDVSAHLRDDRVIKGSFLRHDTLSIDAYLPFYEECISDLQDDVTLPNLGDSIIVEAGIQNRRIGTLFLGFSGEGILVADRSHNAPGFVRPQNLHHVEHSGKVLEGDQLHTLMERGQIACRTGLWIEVEDQPQRYSSEQISSIIVSKNSSARFVMGGIGLAIDVAAIVAYIVTVNTMWKGSFWSSHRY